MKKRWLGMVVVVALLTGAAAGNVRADIIFDNLGNSYAPASPQFLSSTLSLAQRFNTGAQAYTLDNITLRLRDNATSFGNSLVTISLRTDSSGLPGSVIPMTTLSTTLPLGGAFANKAFTPVSPISLSASTT
jgi:hypothetical protein